MKEFYIRRYRSDPQDTSGRRGLLRVNDTGRITYADADAEVLLGYGHGDLRDCPVSRLIATRQDDPFASGHRHQFRLGHPVTITLRHNDGYFFTAEVALRLEQRDADQPADARIVWRDGLQLDPRLLQMMETSAGLGLWELDLASNQVSWSEGLFSLLELRPGCDITPEQALFYCQGNQPRVRALFRRCIRTGQGFDHTFELITARQNLRRVRLTGRAFHEDGQVVRLAGTLVDQTATQQQERAANEARELLGAILGASQDLVVAVDRELRLICCNDAYRHHFEATYQCRPQVGDSLAELLQAWPNDRRLLERLWHRTFEREGFTVEMPLTTRHSGAPVFEVHYQLLRSRDGETLGAVHVARDITDKVRSGGRRAYLSSHDPITGLLNRREFLARTGKWLESGHAQGGALLYLDLDHFTSFNDTAGSGTCDRYLRELASAIGLKVRQRDALARLAGDTFALLLENCAEAEARKVASNILELIEEFVFEWQGQQLATTASAGLLLLGEGLEEAPKDLLSQAADLCHTAKVAGRNRLHAAYADSEALQESEARRLLSHIHQCLDQHTLVLEYQSLRPVSSVTWGDHIEILARFQNPDGDGLLRPGDFLPVAERFDLAKRIDREVIRQTLDWLSRHRLLEPRLKYCGFNLSLASVLDDGFAEFLQTQLAASAFPNESFCLEVSEAHATQYPDEVAVLCDALHELGCRVALDGAGASVESYTLAARLPVDIIKLDQKMVQQLERDPVQQVMVEALHKIAEGAGKATVAPFIEDDDTLRRIRALGIHFGQGYRLHRPRPLADLTPAVVDLETGRIGG
ncbi:EAL domain-containing protein [Marinobacter xestospongiae]|uniref:EAL domain-containing protein n=1 Tax=Marinobacter xestospongiae TaxID=994319 RepID=A0ABU3VVW2_9GAMM|nr:EAL domain-containing protein [Marinobacter xestospongiae]MDV2078399.1 EAL domain-containing protein [Marinobacter xestospongiae]